jgi:hypothetical protein
VHTHRWTAWRYSLLLVFLLLPVLLFGQSIGLPDPGNEISSLERSLSQAQAGARTEALNRALTAIRDALKLAKPESARAFECLLMIELARYQGGKEATLAVDMCKKELEDILRTAPTDYTANVAYGLLSYEVLQVDGFKRFLARLFFTRLPEDLSYDAALLHLLQAKLTRQTPYLYYKLAETYFALNNYRYALESLNLCLTSKEIEPYIDAYYKKLARQLLESYHQQHP